MWMCHSHGYQRRRSRSRRDVLLRQARGATETVERLGDGLHAFWSVAPAEPSWPARLLLDRLVRSGLLMEPFERALAGLDEADGR